MRIVHLGGESGEPPQLSLTRAGIRIGMETAHPRSPCLVDLGGRRIVADTENTERIAHHANTLRAGPTVRQT